MWTTCRACGEDVDFELVYSDISSDWIQIEVECPECGATFCGDIMWDDMYEGVP